MGDHVLEGHGCLAHRSSGEVKAQGIRVGVLRSGAMATSLTGQWSAAQRQAFFGAYANTERQAETGGAIDPAITARTIVRLSQTPVEACVRLIELSGG